MRVMGLCRHSTNQVRYLNVETCWHPCCPERGSMSKTTKSETGRTKIKTYLVAHADFGSHGSGRYLGGLVANCHRGWLLSQLAVRCCWWGWWPMLWFCVVEAVACVELEVLACCDY